VARQRRVRAARSTILQIDEIVGRAALIRPIVFELFWTTQGLTLFFLFKTQNKRPERKQIREKFHTLN
jgi:hypothetical protein